MEKLADISAFMSLQNSFLPVTNVWLERAPSELSDEELKEELRSCREEMQGLKAEMKSVWKQIKTERRKNRLGEYFGSIKGHYDEVCEEYDGVEETYYELCDERAKRKAQRKAQRKASPQPIPGTRLGYGEQGATGYGSPEGTEGDIIDIKHRAPQPAPQPAPQAEPQPAPKPGTRQTTLSERVRPVFQAIDSFVQAAGDFHKWYQTAYQFINTYEKEWDVANKSSKDWKGVQMRSDAYMRTHDFKNIYDKLKGYSVFKEPFKTNPVVEWSKTAPIMVWIKRMQGKEQPA